jgi:hypothetical protein
MAYLAQKVKNFFKNPIFNGNLIGERGYFKPPHPPKLMYGQRTKAGQVIDFNFMFRSKHLIFIIVHVH